MHQPSELRFGVVRAVTRGMAVLDGVHVVQKEGVLGFLFLYGKCHLLADGDMFPIRMRKLDNVSVGQTYKARFVGFLAIYSLSTSTLGFVKN